MQESGYKLNVKACHQGLNDDKTPGRVCTDFGISQIYYKTAWSFDFDLELLTTDLTYSMKPGQRFWLILRNVMVAESWIGGQDLTLPVPLKDKNIKNLLKGGYNE